MNNNYEKKLKVVKSIITNDKKIQLFYLLTVTQTIPKFM